MLCPPDGTYSPLLGVFQGAVTAAAPAAGRRSIVESAVDEISFIVLQVRQVR
jgi:hypothetical protein